MSRNFFGWLSPSPNFLSLNVMKLSPLFSFPFPVWDLTTPPQKNSNLWFLSTIVPDVFLSPIPEVKSFDLQHQSYKIFSLHFLYKRQVIKLLLILIFLFLKHEPSSTIKSSVNSYSIYFYI